MTDLGIKHESIVCCAPKSAMDESEICYPTISVYGEQAALMGLDKLTMNEPYEVTITVRLKSFTTTEREGKKELSGCLEILSMADYQPESDDEDDVTTGIGASVVKAVARGSRRDAGVY